MRDYQGSSSQKAIGQYSLQGQLRETQKSGRNGIMVCPFEVLFEMGFCLSGGQKGRITTGKAKNWAIICLVYLLVVSGAITLATNTAIQYFVLDIFQQTLFVALRTHLHHHHHWDTRK